MPAQDFFEFMLFERMEPFGDRRHDLQAGIIAATIANVNRGKDTEAYVPSDFMLPWDPVPEVVQTQQQQLEMMLFLQAAQNARLEANARNH